MPVSNFTLPKPCKQPSIVKQTVLAIPSPMLSPTAGEAGTSATQGQSQAVVSLPSHLPCLKNKPKINPMERLTGAALSSFFTEGGNGFLKTSSAENFSSPDSF